MATKRRFAVAAALALCPGLLMVTTGIPVAAADPFAETTVVSFTSHVYLSPVTPGQPRRFTIVGDSCQLVAGGEDAIPCTITIAGTVAPGGGQARGAITSARSVITLDETFVFTGPTTSAGRGTATVVDRAGSAGVRFGTFTAGFTTAPTPNPNVLLDTGTVTVRA